MGRVVASRPGRTGRSLEGARLAGPPDRREVVAGHQDVTDPDRRVELRLDSLDSCRMLSVVSTLKHLAVEVSFRPERDRLLDGEVLLDWLVVRIRARVLTAETGERLRLSLQVVGRG